MKRAFITHITRSYIDVAINFVKSIRLFSNTPVIIYCLNSEESDSNKFDEFSDVHFRNIDFKIEGDDNNDYTTVNSGNFYVNRGNIRIYYILCAKTIAMEMALKEGWDEVCYLDSDCLATPLVDELFDYNYMITDYPIATQGIHEYMVWIEDDVQYGNPFAGGSWPHVDNKLSLEWPLMNFLEMSEEQRGIYRTTNVLIMNKNCLGFIETWKELCFILPKLVNVKKYAAYHEETIYNVLNWRKTNLGIPLSYINIGEGIETVKHFYSEDAKEGYARWSDEDLSQNFYKIPDNKKHIKVLHGEKRTSEVNTILDYLTELKNNNYFND